MLAANFARRSALKSTQALRSASTWAAVVAGPPDPILGTLYLTLDHAVNPDHPARC